MLYSGWKTIQSHCLRDQSVQLLPASHFPSHLLLFFCFLLFSTLLPLSYLLRPPILYILLHWS